MAYILMIYPYAGSDGEIHCETVEEVTNNMVAYFDANFVPGVVNPSAVFQVIYLPPPPEVVPD